MGFAQKGAGRHFVTSASILQLISLWAASHYFPWRACVSFSLAAATVVFRTTSLLTLALLWSLSNLHAHLRFLLMEKQYSGSEVTHKLADAL